MSADQLLSDYFVGWHQTYKQNVSNSTQTWYKNIERYIRTYIPDITLQELTRPIFQNFINQLGNLYSTETVRKTRSIIHQAIKEALYSELIFKDPIDGIKAIGKDGKSADMKYLEEPQMKALVDEIQSVPPVERDASDMLILLALNTGARYEELSGLTWTDLRPGLISINKAWDQFTREVKTTKTESSRRVVSVPDNVTDDIFAWRPTHEPSDFVFGSPRPITSAAANKRLREHLMAIHSPKMITFHGLRHTHASWLLSHGVDIQYVSARLGHKSVGMTLRVYTHMMDNLRNSENERSLDLLRRL
jgi:integrase